VTQSRTKKKTTRKWKSASSCPPKNKARALEWKINAALKASKPARAQSEFGKLREKFNLPLDYRKRTTHGRQVGRGWFSQHLRDTAFRLYMTGWDISRIAKAVICKPETVANWRRLDRWVERRKKIHQRDETERIRYDGILQTTQAYFEMLHAPREKSGARYGIHGHNTERRKPNPSKPNRPPNNHTRRNSDYTNPPLNTHPKPPATPSTQKGFVTVTGPDGVKSHPAEKFTRRSQYDEE
jgi:hypothetical protein